MYLPYPDVSIQKEIGELLSNDQELLEIEQKIIHISESFLNEVEIEKYA